MAVFLIIPFIVFIGLVTYELWLKGQISAQEQEKLKNKTSSGKRKTRIVEEDWEPKPVKDFCSDCCQFLPRCTGIVQYDSLFMFPGNPGYRELQKFFREATDKEVVKMYKLIEGKNTLSQAKKFLEEWIGHEIKTKTKCGLF